MKFGKSLEDQVKTLREEIDSFIDAKAAEIKTNTPGVPELVLRNLLTARAGGCQCQALLNIMEDDRKANAA